MSNVMSSATICRVGMDQARLSFQLLRSMAPYTCGGGDDDVATTVVAGKWSGREVVTGRW